VLGMDYAYVGVRRSASGISIVQGRATDAPKNTVETVTRVELVRASDAVYLRVIMTDSARFRFAYSASGRADDYHDIGEALQAREGRWVGAKVGLFAEHASGPKSGFADFDFFRISK